MYGKHFESMYDGSMYGAGVAVFAVWGYVISHTRDSRVELNPVKLADTLGGELEDIEAALKKLQEPDPRSRHKDNGGRRLIPEGQFQYFVPSWEDYQRLKNESDRREYNRQAKRRERRRKAEEKGKVLPVRSKPLPGEKAFSEAQGNGELRKAEEILNQNLPAQSKVSQFPDGPDIEHEPVPVPPEEGHEGPVPPAAPVPRDPWESRSEESFPEV